MTPLDPPREPAKLRCISMDFEEGEPEGIVWAEPANKKLTRQWFGDRLCSYLDDMENGEEMVFTFRRHDMTKDELDALPEI